MSIWYQPYVMTHIYVTTVRTLGHCRCVCVHMVVLCVCYVFAVMSTHPLHHTGVCKGERPQLWESCGSHAFAALALGGVTVEIMSASVLSAPPLRADAFDVALIFTLSVGAGEAAGADVCGCRRFAVSAVLNPYRS